MQFILKFLILFFACGIAMVLIMRLQRTTQRLAELHQELRKNDEEMAAQRRRLDQMSRENSASSEGEIKS